MIEALPVIMLVSLAALLFTGLPVAIVLAGLGIFFSIIGVVVDEMPFIALYNIPLKMFGSIGAGMFYPAVVMLLFMGVTLEKSGIADELLRCLHLLLRRVPGGLAISVIFIGVILAPAAGLVGASVVTLGLIALPAMMRRGYRPETACGAVAAAGTVGLILPPAVMLFFLARLFDVTIGSMFLATVVPGCILIAVYVLYFLLNGWRNPEASEGEDLEAPSSVSGWLVLLFRGLFLPTALVTLVLGAIIFGWATPRQSAGIGAAGGLLLMLINGRMSFGLMRDVVTATSTLTAMVFFIILAASIFTYPFVYFGGNDLIADAMNSMDLTAWGALLVILAVIFVLGFFIDWIEITVIVMPLFLPVLKTLDFAMHGVPGKLGMIWIAALVALTLQTSFITPPFGFALFFLKGASPPNIRLSHIYRGILPVLAVQVVGIGLLMALPFLATWLPVKTYGL